MNLQDLLTEAETKLAGVNLPQLLAVVSSAINALPAIEAGVLQALPYIQALQIVVSGGTPTDADWAALDARLDAGSQALQDAAAEPDPNAISDPLV